MQIAIFGATGFVGSHIARALDGAGHSLAVLVRHGSEAKLPALQRCRIETGDIADAAAIAATVSGCNAVIYSIGLLREFPRRGITFDETQLRGVERVIAAAKAAGVERFVLLSANGVESCQTPYQKTKYAAEQALRSSGLRYTIMQPSVIFGAPGMNMEFATQLYREMVQPPLPAIGFFSGARPQSGPVLMSPIHVDDVSELVVVALEQNVLIDATAAVGGPETLSWVQMIERIATAAGKSKWVVPMPIAAMKMAATIFDWLPVFPVTRDQLTMLAENNIAPATTAEELLQRPLLPFDRDQLGYLMEETHATHS